MQAHLQETKGNHFAVRLKAKKAGRTTLRLAASAHGSAKKHFKTVNSVYRDSVTVAVFDSMAFVKPPEKAATFAASLLMAPNSETELQMNRSRSFGLLAKARFETVETQGEFRIASRCLMQT